jgi:hypothetical protein
MRQDIFGIEESYGRAGRLSVQFLFTDNHSTDRTFEKLSRVAAADADVRIARFARNFGFQQSVLTGYRTSPASWRSRSMPTSRPAVVVCPVSAKMARL